MDAKALKEITSELSVLYVEDDDNLRAETSKLFGHLFNTVETAENGQTAIAAMKEKNFDLIITDINMPVIDGLGLTRHIREHDAKQTILVTSAHNESHYLLELIELGIDKFILKPLDMPKLLSTLSSVCTNIINEKLINKYKQELIESNLQLRDSNEELETLVKILDTKIEQLGKLDTVTNNSKTQVNPRVSDHAAIPLHDPISADSKGLYLYKEYVFKEDQEELLKLEGDIFAEVTGINLHNSIEEKSVIRLADMLYRYHEVLDTYPLFKTISDEIRELVLAMKDDTSVFIEHASEILILFESFLYVLKKWRTALFEEGIKDPDIFNTSIINDLQTMIIILKKDAFVEQNLEFF